MEPDIKVTHPRPPLQQNVSVLRSWRSTGARVLATVRRGASVESAPVLHPAFATLAIGLFCLLVFAAALDPYILAWVRGHEDALGIIAYKRAVTDAAKSHYYFLTALALMGIISASRWGGRPLAARRARLVTYAQASFVFATVLGLGIAINVAKQFIGRGRPRTAEEFGVYAFQPFQFESAFQSFPSGHSTTAGSLAMLLALFYPRYIWLFLGCGFLLALTRVAAQAHYFSDVIAGFAIGTCGTLLAARWLARRRILFAVKPAQLLPKLTWT